ncbi:MAG: alanine racemase, partial [Myxococcota bacterium]
MGERRAHAIIDLSALRSNFLRARELSGEREVIAVVKADAYGHGAGPAARSLESVGCRRFAVVSVGEACELREAGVTGGVLVMGGLVSGDEARLVAEYGLCPVVHHDRDLELVREAARIQEGPISVEIEVDTGMQRMGVAIEEAVSLAHAVAGDPATRLAGIFTHFAHAENPEPEASLEQIAAFRALIHELRAAGIDPGCIDRKSTRD